MNKRKLFKKEQKKQQELNNRFVSIIDIEKNPWAHLNDDFEIVTDHRNQTLWYYIPVSQWKSIIWDWVRKYSL